MRQTSTTSKIGMLALGLALMGIGAIPPSEGVTWYDFEGGLAKAKGEKKMIVLDVYTDWCHWCKVMDTSTYGDDAVIALLNEHFVAVKINPEKSGDVMYKGQKVHPMVLIQSLGIQGYPATVFMEENHDLVTVVPGYLDAPTFLGILEYIGEKHYYKISYEKFLQLKESAN